MLALWPDTNFLMECRSLQELPWRELPGDEEHVRLVLGRSVVREVDRFKSDGKARRSRRARKLSSGLFRQLLDAAGQPVVLQDSGPRVDAVLSDARPDPAPDLDLSIPDDRIVAEAVAHGRAHAVSFFSHDTMALHTAAAQGLAWLRIPDDWLADPEPDPRQKQVEELERRIRLLEGDSPAIEITLETGPATIHVVQHAALPAPLIAELVEDVRRRFPVRLDFHDPRSDDPFRILTHFQPPTSMEIEDYQSRKYPAWIQSIEQGLMSLPERLSAETRCAEITIEIANTGGSPAREVQLECWLSEGLTFLHPPDEARRNMAASPLRSPPLPPRGRQLGDHFGDLLRRPYAPDVLSTFERLQQSRRDPHEFYYKPVPDNENDQHVLECEVFRHRVESEPFSFLVYAERDVTGGTITCRVTASNLSEPVFAEFPIRVEYRDGDATQIAQEMVAQIGRGEDNESRAR